MESETWITHKQRKGGSEEIKYDEEIRRRNADIDGMRFVIGQL